MRVGVAITAGATTGAFFADAVRSSPYGGCVSTFPVFVVSQAASASVDPASRIVANVFFMFIP